MFCEGQLLPISENETLFQLIGTTYGGDGESTFALPDLRGRLPIHQGNGVHPRRDGRRRGGHADAPSRSPPTATRCSVTTGVGDGREPGRAACSAQPAATSTSTEHGAPGARWRPSRRRPTGGSQPHTNMQPYLCVNFIISLFGIFPSPDLGATMADPFVAEIRIFPFNFAPKGWACVRRPAAADLAEHRALLAARHHLRRQRQVDLRAAGPAGRARRCTRGRARA